jgi:putative membrane protein
LSYPLRLLLIFALVFIWSAIQPKDYFTWLLEVFPAILGVLVLFFTRKTFPLTQLTYFLILLHCCILLVGGHYTYAEVPLFNWLKEVSHQTRNNYDKVGHFAQGFVPAIISREILIRKQVIYRPNWLPFLIVTICVFISALYEFLEWLVAELSGESADAFLGVQGYVWDTQSDMLYATIGAIMALLTLSKLHDKQLNK